MYRLPQKGLMAKDILEKGLNKRDYQQIKLVPSICKHDWSTVQFTLVVDDFGVNYVGKEHALHRKHIIEENYTVTSEWDGRRYIVITLNWEYNRIQVHLSMLQYVTKALNQFNHKL